MIAVFQDRNKQYRVSEGEEVLIDFDKSLEAGNEITFDKVLYVGGGEQGQFGSPFVDGAKVVGTVKGHERGPKITVFTFKRRKDSRRKKGHRQELTRVAIQQISG